MPPASGIRRLHRAADYRRVYRRGSAWNHPFLTLRSWRSNGPEDDSFRPRDVPSSSIRLGIVTGKRIGAAVVRNRVKRILREVGRRVLREAGGSWDLVVIARPPIVGHPSEEIERSLRELLRRASVR